MVDSMNRRVLMERGGRLARELLIRTVFLCGCRILYVQVKEVRKRLYFAKKMLERSVFVSCGCLLAYVCAICIMRFDCHIDNYNLQALPRIQA